ncbi:hypothetical protein [Synechocystis sp. PCC 7509]|nr:hypothetical protein [Synechocystis sp. PCC 7509]
MKINLENVTISYISNYPEQFKPVVAGRVKKRKKCGRQSHTALFFKKAFG